MTTARDRSLTPIVLLVLGVSLAGFTWFAEVFTHGWLRVLLPLESLAAALLMTAGAWSFVRRAVKARVGTLPDQVAATTTGFMGWFILTAATVAAVNSAGFFGGSAVASAQPQFLSGLASLVLAVLYLVFAGLSAVTGAALVWLDHLCIKARRPAWVKETPPEAIEVPYAPGGAPDLTPAQAPVLVAAEVPATA